MNEKPLFIDFDQAAKIASVCKRTVANWARAKAISTVKIGRVVRVNREQFIAEVQRFTRNAAA